VRVAVTGATGTVGREVVRALLRAGDAVTVLSRDPGRATATLGEGVEAHAWRDPKATPPPIEALRGRDGVINLLGEPLAQRWSDAAKVEIRDSRVLSTRNLVGALGALSERPRVLVSQSASGVYGAHGDEPVDESTEPADDFLARVCKEWEASATRAQRLGVRVVIARTGVVLSRSGGALQKMLPPFKLGLGGPVAGGRQYLPWVHVEDVAGALVHCLHTDAASGPVNVVAPAAVTNREFSKALGRVLGRPAVTPVPAVAMRLLYGEMATTVTGGARLVPKRLLELGYEFRRPELEDALRAETSKGPG
jgi:uncharacterized protein (TIGR01777 family)